MRLSVFISILISALCYYFGNGLTGDYWYLVWIAPAPIIYTSLTCNKRTTFTMAFLACLLGRMSWLAYLIRVATITPAITAILLLSLAFAGIILLNRSIALKLKSWYALFFFPLLFTAFEYLLLQFSADGTAGSIAYSQMNFLPIIQVAAIGGILAITFLITLIPSFIVFAIIYPNKKLASTCLFTLIAGILVWGHFRITDHPSSLQVGLAVSAEAHHTYPQQIDSLATQGAKIILLPERAFEEKPLELQASAIKNNTYIIAGYTNNNYNSALVIDNTGHIILNYNKRHLVTGFERQFTPGNQIGLFNLHNIPSAVAICKDLDFPAYIRSYGKHSPSLLFIPAWDFIVDDWLHARMAILRGVENGFSEVRAARTGLLTISDCYGQVTSQSSSTHEQATTLTNTVSLHHINTPYTTLGDWPGGCSLLLSLLLYFFAFSRLKVSGEIPK